MRTRVHGEAEDLALNPRDGTFQLPDLRGSSASLGMAQVSKETYCKAKKDLLKSKRELLDIGIPLSKKT